MTTAGRPTIVSDSVLES
jgi:solute carrier family 30 (zinc transporter), member 2